MDYVPLYVLQLRVNNMAINFAKLDFMIVFSHTELQYMVHHIYGRLVQQLKPMKNQGTSDTELNKYTWILFIILYKIDTFIWKIQSITFVNVFAYVTKCIWSTTLPKVQNVTHKMSPTSKLTKMGIHNRLSLTIMGDWEEAKIKVLWQCGQLPIEWCSPPRPSYSWNSKPC